MIHPDTGLPVGERTHEEHESMICQVCHMAVSYIRQALTNDETEKEIEKV
jgi:hypothetical protein